VARTGAGFGRTWAYAGAGLLAWFAAGCSSSNASPSSNLPDAHLSCPETLAETIGAACAVDGQSCYPAYACGAQMPYATCLCTAGSFVCKDLLGAPLVQGSTPGCPDAAATPACPSTYTLANRVACQAPGQVCTYASPCVSIPAFLSCECMPATQIDGGLLYEFSCDNECEGPPAPSDGGPDAEAGASVDAAPEASREAEAGPTTPVVDATAPDATSSDAAVDALLE
jgi:hypothetical protein